MTRGAIGIGRLAGIPVKLHPLWFGVVALFTAVLGSSYYPDAVPGISRPAAYALAFATVIGLFACVVAHELGHALVARRYGVEIDEIDLWPLGGVARMRRMPDTPSGELRMAIAGPLVSLTLAATVTAAGAAIPGDRLAALHESLLYLGALNGFIAVFNLVPALPLDGGRIAHAAIWRRTGDRDRATTLAAAGGHVFGWLFVAVGLVSWLGGTPPGPWLALIGAFILAAARAEAQQAMLHRAFGGVAVRDLMSGPPRVIAEDASAAEAAEELARSRYTALPVVAPNGRAVGLLSVDDVAELPPSRRRETSVRALAHRDPDLLVPADRPVSEVLELPAFTELGRAVVTDERERPIGVLSLTDIERALRAQALLHPGARAA